MTVTHTEPLSYPFNEEAGLHPHQAHPAARAGQGLGRGEMNYREPARLAPPHPHGPPADLVDAYALPILVAVICELLGVPVADRPKFRVWSDAALSTSGLTAEEFERNREELRDYMRGLIAEHREQPHDDLMTALIEARDTRDRLTELELVDLCVGILVAGHETTASQIPNFVYALLDQHEHWKRL